jgi:hypothetical protein
MEESIPQLGMELNYRKKLVLQKPCSFPCGSKKSSIDAPNDLFTLLRGKGGKVVGIVLFSLAEAF